MSFLKPQWFGKILENYEKKQNVNWAEKYTAQLSVCSFINIFLVSIENDK